MTSSMDFVALRALLQPERLALVDLARGERWTRAELNRAVAQGVTQLRRMGVREGDRVGALARNSGELLILHFACTRLGAIYVPLNWRLNPQELRAILADAAPRVLLGDGFLDAAGLSGQSLEEFARDRKRQVPAGATAMPMDRPSLLLYTSGTCGQPKGVVLTENQLNETARNTVPLCRITRESVFLVDAPMFHVIGLVVNIRPALTMGGSVVISDGFVPARTLERLSDPALGVTHYFCVPQMAAALRADRAYDPALLRRLTALFTGGAHHPAAQIRRWLADGILAVDGYGMSETGTVFGMPIEPGLIDTHAGSVGQAPPGLACRIVNADGQPCAPDESGELQVKGPNVMHGYWQRPEETAQAFTADGWFRTGDIVRRDGQGFHWLVGRSKEMYISGGENIYPAEIETVLAGDPGIEECAVVGVPDERWGEVGHLFVKPVAGVSLDPMRIAATLERKIARYKLPKRICEVQLLPRNGAGKVLKCRLRHLALTALANEAQVRPVSAAVA